MEMWIVAPETICDAANIRRLSLLLRTGDTAATFLALCTVLSLTLTCLPALTSDRRP
jgi:hypothetical protein